jgi:hypothetical protein
MKRRRRIKTLLPLALSGLVATAASVAMAAGAIFDALDAAR